MQLQRIEEFVIAQRRGRGAETATLGSHAIAYPARGSCQSTADDRGRIALLCRRDDRFECTVSDDGGLTWIGEPGGA